MAFELPPSAYVVQIEALPSLQLSSIIKFPPGGGQSGQTTAYTELSCSDEDRAHIYELIMTMAREGKVSLLFKQNHMKWLGAKICHVHPLRFLAVIFTDPQLKECMRDVFDDHFKRNGFMDGLGSSLSREADKGMLDGYLKEFAAEVGVKLTLLQECVQSRDWDGFVRVLIEAGSQET